ncbi:MAG: formimidoylglutamate deiminase [Pyrinomonadaceae bacterium]|nr:formimidoylglutamate deiminase [Pyrinomonadaceae bacterium]
MKFHFKKLLQNDGWLENVVVETKVNGVIIAIEENVSEAESSNYLAIPGFQNAHSHAFQYAMAGIAENHSAGESDFWSWREAMYKLALALDPDQLEAIATMLYAEMLRHGYTHVAEFHYLHHEKNGKPFDNLAEMGSRLISAAKTAGIGITLVPIFYQKGGFDKSPEPNQKRFISNSVEGYQKLFEASERACRHYEHANIAIGIHSLRGVEPEAVKEVAENFSKDIPFHIHISEQLKEVADCEAFLGKRPVEWMLENIDLSDRFHFVHATHLNEGEIAGLAEKGVNVVLCPTTEGNLGDGIFPLIEFQNHSGNWSIGTDSHVSLNPFEELRLLDYGQRLISHKRDSFTGENGGSSAVSAIRQTTIAGRKAMNNFSQDYFSVDQSFNACVISAEHPLIQTSSRENLLNTIVYSSDETMQRGAIFSGNWKIINPNHEFTQNFVKVLKDLKHR